MFLEDSDFEDNEPKAKSKSESKRNDKDAKVSSNQKEMMMKMESFGIDDDPGLSEDVVDDSQDDDGGFGSAGALGVGSSSRARMLAQQRELQLKKRHAAIQSSGMMRSSSDGGIPEQAAQEDKKKDNKFTPAVRQFSAPKAVKDPSADTAEQSSEFQGRNDPTIPRRIIADEDSRRWRDDRDDYYDDDRDRYQGRDRDRFNERERGWNNARHGDDEDYYNGHSGRRYDDDYDRRSRGRDTRDDRGGRDRGDYGGRDRGDYGGRGDEWEDAGSRYESNRRNNYRDGRNSRDEYSRDAERERARQRVSAEPRRPFPLDLSNKRKFLNSPIPKEAGIVQCYILRDKSSNLKNPVYSLYLKEDDVFLLTSRNRTKIQTSNYLISMAESDFDRQGPNYVGKLRSNLLGTEFQVFDDGYNPKDADDAGGGNGHNQSVRKSLAVVVYAANYMGYRGPRKMQVVIPSVDENGEISRSIRPGEEDFLGRIKDKNYRDLVYMINKPPRWNDQVGAYVLNFNGRVTMASVKNFQLVDPEEQNVVILQFGRVGKDEFTMDLQWPMSPLQAFAITMSSFDSKFACD